MKNIIYVLLIFFSNISLSEEQNKFIKQYNQQLKKDAKKKAVLKVYLEIGDVELVFYSSLKDVQTTGLSLSSDKASIYYDGRTCGWGDCAADHIYLGSAEVVKIK